MMKFERYIYPLLTLLCLGGCSNELELTVPGFVDNGDTFTIHVSLNVGDLTSAQSRAFGDVPDYSDLKLYVIEFDCNDKDRPMGNTLSKNFGEMQTTLAADGDLHFNIELDKSVDPKILHFIAVPDGAADDFDFEGDGIEGSIIPALSVGYNGDVPTPAYWNRVVFENGYGSYNDAGTVWSPNSEVCSVIRDESGNVIQYKAGTKLAHVPMIRNFAKISLKSSNANFTLEGFALINQSTKGTVAPWNNKVQPLNFPTMNDGYEMLSYMMINGSDDGQGNYHGYSPFSEESDIRATFNPEADINDTGAKYLYERPHTSINYPYLIIKGRRNEDASSKYYKLDLGRNGEDKLFEFYDILRNFEYEISLTEVAAEGYASAQEARDGAVFNNFSFDVTTRSMLNVSNGEAMLWVNKATIVVTSAENGQNVIHFLYKYKPDIDDNNYDNGDIDFKNLVIGKAIANITYDTETDEEKAEGWKGIDITTTEPTDTRESQDFIVYSKSSGLGRTISIIVRNPWNYFPGYTNEAGTLVGAPSVYGLNYDTFDQYRDQVITNYSQWKGKVSTKSVNEPLTVAFYIPDEIPESMFPLLFYFEANPNIITNNPDGNLTWALDTTFFPVEGASTQSRTLKFVKSVSWADYNADATSTGATAAPTVTFNNAKYHFVRARFLTTEAPSLTTPTQIRVYNPYILDNGNKYIELEFTGLDEEAPTISNN